LKNGSVKVEIEGGGRWRQLFTAVGKNGDFSVAVAQSVLVLGEGLKEAVGALL
jgi:hypothetical protein